MIRILLVDDHPVVQAGCQRLLESEPDLRVVALAASVDEACGQWARQPVDLTITDLSLPGSGGLELIRRLLERAPEARVLVFSMRDSEALVRRALALGARGYVPKSAAPESLIEAVRTVMRGQRALAPGLPAHLLQDAGHEDPLSDLTPRELEILRLLASGWSVADCARALHLSPKTASNLQTQIKDKLGLSNAAAMAHFALRHGLIALDGA
jgi:two-component system invasion response regulator UvrY